MLENYLIKGLVIGMVFGVPAGAVGVLSIQRVLTQGAFAGLATGMGSSAADVLYACVGVFGITIISDFLLRYQRFICMAGCLIVIFIGIRTFGRNGSPEAADRTAEPRHVMSCFLSAFAVAIANPAAVISFMVVFSIFQIGGTESAAENFQLVFGIFAGTCVWWLAIAVTVSLLRKRVTERFYLTLNRIFGIFMILFGIVIGVQGCLH